MLAHNTKPRVQTSLAVRASSLVLARCSVLVRLCSSLSAPDCEMKQRNYDFVFGAQTQRASRSPLVDRLQKGFHVLEEQNLHCRNTESLKERPTQ